MEKILKDSFFMEPILKMSVISTLKDLTEAYVGPMVSWLHYIAMEGGLHEQRFASSLILYLI